MSERIDIEGTLGADYARAAVESQAVLGAYIQARLHWIAGHGRVPTTVTIAPAMAATLLRGASPGQVVPEPDGRPAGHFGNAVGCDWYQDAAVPDGEFRFE